MYSSYFRKNSLKEEREKEGKDGRMVGKKRDRININKITFRL